MWGAIAGAAIGAASSLLNQHSANKNSSANANAANAFTREQWLNKHQWEVSDLKAAGLNPILSATGGGSPASSAMASTQMADVGSAISSGASAARVASLISAEKDKIRQETSTSEASASTLKSQQQLNEANIRNNTALATTQAAKNVAEAKYLNTQANSKSVWGELGKDVEKVYSSARKSLSDTPAQVAEKVARRMSDVRENAAKSLKSWYRDLARNIPVSGTD